MINDAKKYIDMFLDKSYVAVSLRTVKMAISLRSKHPADIRKVAKIVVNKCIDEIGQILSSISGQYFMTIDIGRFSVPKASSFMTSAIATEIINKMIKIIYGTKQHGKALLLKPPMGSPTVATLLHYRKK